MRLILFAVTALSLASGFAYAASNRLPPEVSAHIEDMSQSCREAGGTPMAPQKGFLISGNLIGEGSTDWAIDEGKFNCDGAQDLFSGSGGSQIFVFAGIPGNEARQPFETGAYGMRLERRTGRDTLWIKVGGELCGQSGESSNADAIACERPLVWNKTTQQFDFAPLSTIKILGRPKTP